jgi:predicted nucleic acid-binding protein
MPGKEKDDRPVVYLDANPFIYLVESDQDISSALLPMFEAVRRRPGSAVNSEVTLAEVLAPASRIGSMPLAVKRRAYLSLLVWDPSITLKPVTRDILYETAELRSLARLKLPDAIHLVTAIRCNCRFFVSSDGDFKAMPTGMTVIRPGKDSLLPIMEALT